MSIPYLPGWGDTLAQILPQIGQNLNKIVNPNFELQQGLKQAVATHPELAQQLANLEAQNPGTLKNLIGASEITNILSSLTPDQATKENIALGNDINQLFQNPTARAEILARKTGTLTPEQRQGQQQQLDINADTLAKRKAKNDLESLADYAVKKHPNWTPANFYTDFTPEEQGAIISSDKYGKLFDTRLAQYNKRLDQEFAIRMRQADRADRRQEIADQWQQQKMMTLGMDMFKQSHGQVSLNAAATLASDPNAITIAKELAAQPGNENNELVRAYNWMQAENGKEFLQKQYDNERKAVDDMFVKTGNNKGAFLKNQYTPEMLQYRVDRINKLSESLGNPERLQVGEAGMIFKHPILTVTNVDTGTQTTMPATTDSNYQKAKAIVEQADPAQRKALLQKLSAKNPQYAQQIATELGIK